MNGPHGVRVENDSTGKAHLEMSQWVVYCRRREYPDKYVARRWGVRAGQITATYEVKLADTLEEIRRRIPPWLYCLRRFEDDDPCIVEVWL